MPVTPVPVTAIETSWYARVLEKMRATLLTRWKERSRSQLCGSAVAGSRARGAVGQRSARVLIASREPVVHQMGGSTTYLLNLTELFLRAGAEVTLLVTSAGSRSPRLFFRVLQPLPPEVRLRTPGYLRLGGLYVRPLAPRAWARAAARLAVRHRRWRLLAEFMRRRFGDRVYRGAWDQTPATDGERHLIARELHQRPDEPFTTVVANYASLAALLTAAPPCARRAVLMHDLLSARTERFAASGTPLDMPPVSEAQEVAWLGEADLILAAQESEAEWVRARLPSVEVRVPPVALAANASSAEPVPGRCLFVGSNIAPNQMGLLWFLQEVWPRIRAAQPEAQLTVVGSVGAALEGEWPGVTCLGRVASLAAEYAQASVCVVPLRLGTGVKIKLIEALSFGKATVSTSVGVQGLEAWAPGAVEVADDPEGFAAAVGGLLRNPGWRRKREADATAAFREHGMTVDPEFLNALLSPSRQCEPELVAADSQEEVTGRRRLQAGSFRSEPR